MKRLMAVLIALFIFCSPAVAATTLTKAIDMTQLALDETPISLWNNSTGKVSILLTTKNVYLLTEPTTAGSMYTIEKVVLPTMATGESITNFWYENSSGKPTAMITNKGIYLFKTA